MVENLAKVFDEVMAGNIKIGPEVENAIFYGAREFYQLNPYDYASLESLVDAMKSIEQENQFK